MGRTVLFILGCLLIIQFVAWMARHSRALLPGAVLVARAAKRFGRRLLNPTIIARRVGLRPGMKVLHVGVPDDCVAAALIDTVGPSGRVQSVALTLETPERFPFEDHSFDAVCLVSALGRFRDRNQAKSEIWRVLRPSGRLSASDVVSDPTFRFRRSVEAWAESAGFECLEHFGGIVAYTTNFRKPLFATPA
jgi:SAM-dependent methyltransferase